MRLRLYHHDDGAEIVLRAVLGGHVAPERIVLMANRMHANEPRPRLRTFSRLAAQAGVVPGLDRALTHATRVVFAPERGLALSARANPAAEDVMRHAFADVPGNANLARSWAKCARVWPRGAQTHLRDEYARLKMP